MGKSSIVNESPAPHTCEVCGGARLYTTAEPLCWICFRLYSTVEAEAKVERKLWEQQEKE